MSTDPLINVQSVLPLVFELDDTVTPIPYSGYPWSCNPERWSLSGKKRNFSCFWTQVHQDRDSKSNRNCRRNPNLLFDKLKPPFILRPLTTGPNLRLRTTSGRPTFGNTQHDVLSRDSRRVSSGRSGPISLPWRRKEFEVVKHAGNIWNRISRKTSNKKSNKKERIF